MSVRKPSILLVDDDVQCLNVRRVLFETFGFRVTECSSPRQALRYFQAKRFDVAVLDFQMPEMNGGELATAMKKVTSTVPVVILSGLPYLPEDTPQNYDAFFCKTEPCQKIVRGIESLIASSGSGGNGHRLPLTRRLLAMTGVAVGFATQGFTDVWGKVLPHRGDTQYGSVAV